MPTAAKSAKNASVAKGLVKPSTKKAAMKAKTAPARRVVPIFKRADLVGKFPQVKHLAAPKGARRLDCEERKQILASMLLG